MYITQNEIPTLSLAVAVCHFKISVKSKFMSIYSIVTMHVVIVFQTQKQKFWNSTIATRAIYGITRST